MAKSIGDIRREKQAQYYPNGLPSFNDFKVGDRVKVITPCEDYYFFSEETGTIYKIDTEYLGINVIFDTPRPFKDGYIQKDFNFNPESIVKIKETEIKHCLACGVKI